MAESIATATGTAEITEINPKSIISTNQVIGADEIRKKLAIKTQYEEVDEREKKLKQKQQIRSNEKRLKEVMKDMTSDEVFDLFDDDESGFLGFNEFRQILPGLGIVMNDAKAYRYFKMCDSDGSGEIDRDEFKVALFTCDPSSSSRVGYVPNGLLTPLDAFETFDENGIGHLNEDEFYFAFDYLNVKLTEPQHETLFHSIDVNRTECVDYYEFREAFLHHCNLRKELNDRGVIPPYFCYKSTLIDMLRDILNEEEEKERAALAETAQHKQWIFSLKDKRRYLQRAQWRAYQELRSCLDAAGQVYVFGEGSHGQFNPGGRPKKSSVSVADGADIKEGKLSTSQYEFLHSEKIVSMWKDRIHPEQLVNRLGKIRRQEKQDEKRYNAQLLNGAVPGMGGGDGDALIMKDRQIDPYEEAVMSPFRGLCVSASTAFLWGRRIHHVAVSENVIFAMAVTGEIYAWGGQNYWWNEIQPDSIYQKKWRGDITPRSQLLLNIADKSLPIYQSCESDLSEEDLKFGSIKTVTKYYNVWESPPSEAQRLTFLEKVLLPKLSYDAMQFGLLCRGKEKRELTLMELVEEMAQDLQFEKKVLGERAHKALRELEFQAFDLKKKRKMKHSKKVQEVVQQMWQPLLTIQIEQRSQQKKQKEREARLRKEKKETDFVNYRKRLDDNRNDSESQTIGNVDIHLHGVTPRGPALLTPRGSQAGLQISAGNSHACCIHKSGLLYSWGLGAIGRLGHDQKSRNYDPQQDVSKPKLVESLQDRTIVRVSCGHSHTGAIDSDGNLFMWGSIAFGKCGIPTPPIASYASQPTLLNIGNNIPIRKISCGSAHTAVVTKTGQLYVFGCGDGGRLGLGIGKYESVLPTLVQSLLQEQIASVSCGNSTTVALSEVRALHGMFSGGKVYVAGSASVLGREYSEFTLLEDMRDIPVKHVSCGYQHTALLTPKGELYCWGRNSGVCCGVAPQAHFLEHPTYVDCLFREQKNLALGSKAAQSSTFNGRVASLAIDGDKSGTERTSASTDSELKAWFEIDLGQYATINEIRLWNRTDKPRDPVIPTDYFTSRLFPCWILIGIDPFDKNPLLDVSFQNSKSQAVAHTKLSEHQRTSIWKCPANTQGRYVRVQLEGYNYLSISQLEVFGNWGSTADMGRVAHVIAGRDVTVAVIRPEENLEKYEIKYQRAVYSDVGNAEILRQYEAYQPHYDRHGRGMMMGKCPICRGTIPCQTCLLNKMYGIEIHQMDRYHEERRRLDSIEAYLIAESPKPTAPPPIRRVFRPKQESFWGFSWLSQLRLASWITKPFRTESIAPELMTDITSQEEKEEMVKRPIKDRNATRTGDGQEEEEQSIGHSVLSLGRLQNYLTKKLYDSPEEPTFRGLNEDLILEPSTTDSDRSKTQQKTQKHETRNHIEGRHLQTHDKIERRRNSKSKKRRDNLMGK